MELTERLEARIDPESKSLLRKAAEINRQSLSEFVIAAALGKAKRILDHDNTWRLTPDQSAEFVTALLSGSEPNDALQSAAKRYQDSELG